MNAITMESFALLKSYPIEEKKLFLLERKNVESNQHPLFRGLKEGDRKSVENIYRDFFPKVRYWIIQNSGSEDDAYDVFQETLENILLKVEDIHTSFEALVLKIAKYKWIDKIRKSKRIEKVRNESVRRLEDEVSLEEDLIKKEKDYLKYKILEESFLQLSTLCQQLMTMIKRGIKVAEIVDQLEFSNANTLYRRKAACMDRWANLTKDHPSYKYYLS